MNQLVGSKPDGTKFVALVLEPGNLQRLKERKPILLRIEDFFPDGIPKRLELLISYSETPVADAREFAKEAEAVFDERSRVSESKRPHCPECHSTLEQLGMMKSEAPIHTVFCVTCGCALGVVPKDK